MSGAPTTLAADKESAARPFEDDARRSYVSQGSVVWFGLGGLATGLQFPLSSARLLFSNGQASTRIDHTRKLELHNSVHRDLIVHTRSAILWLERMLDLLQGNYWEKVPRESVHRRTSTLQ